MSRAETGQLWRDKDTRGGPRVVFVLEVDGHHAQVRNLSTGRASRIRLDEHGGLRGYELVAPEVRP